MGSIAGDILGDLIYASIIGLLGFGVYAVIRRGLSKRARRIAIGLVTAAIVFSLAVVSWDIADGTTTSTESFIVVIAGVPMLLALAVVKIVDRGASDPQQRRT